MRNFLAHAVCYQEDEAVKGRVWRAGKGAYAVEWGVLSEEVGGGWVWGVKGEMGKGGNGVDGDR